MAETESDWVGAGIISAGVMVLGGAFFWVTSSQTGQRPMVWARLLALRLLLALVLWAVTVFSNRRKLGPRTCFELGILLLIGFAAFGLGRIFSEVSVESMLTSIDLGGLPTAMFLSGAFIVAIALSVALRLIRFQGVPQGTPPGGAGLKA